MTNVDRWESIVRMVKELDTKVVLFTARDFIPRHTLGPLALRHGFDLTRTGHRDDSLRFLRLEKNAR